VESGLNEIHCRALSALLGYSVGTVLWPHYEARILARDSHTELTTRVGRGRATYHRVDKSSRHLIVFGWKMVQQKSLGWPAASRWTSGREIVNRGYYSGHVDLLSVLAHAACHEFAHLLQSVEGKRKRGSVHNAAFYSLLDEMHREGVADEVLALLVEQCRDVDFDVGWAKGLEDSGALQGLGQASLRVPRGRQQKHERPKVEIEKKALFGEFGSSLNRENAGPSVCPGDAVCFTVRGERITGRVRRVNRCTVTIVPDHPDRPGQYWRVGPDLCERI